jgi:hypothetical protein
MGLGNPGLCRQAWVAHCVGCSGCWSWHDWLCSLLSCQAGACMSHMQPGCVATAPCALLAVEHAVHNMNVAILVHCQLLQSTTRLLYKPPTGHARRHTPEMILGFASCVCSRIFTRCTGYVREV